MTATENEPRIETHRPAGGLVVMKFGSSSVGGPERIKDVARRLVAAHARGDRVVGVVSAMGRTTEELLSLARRVSPQPDPRELDVLLTVGERIAGALLAMAITDLGPEAVSLTGSQAGIVTDGAHGRARIVEIRAQRVEHALEHGRIVLVAGFQGISSALDLTTLGRGGTVAFHARLELAVPFSRLGARPGRHRRPRAGARLREADGRTAGRPPVGRIPTCGRTDACRSPATR